MDRRCCYKDLLPFTSLVGNESIIVGVYTLFKVATLQGLSNYVFIAYSYTVSTIVLLPVYFFYTRSRVVPQLSFSILFKIALLGVIGCSSQILGYAGISYSSPTLSSAIGNLIPAFTFILAVICRMEKIAIKSRTTQAKVWGSIISISGAFIVTFYKGKSIIIAHNSPSIHLQQSNSILTSIDTNWVIGGLLLTISNILLTVWFIAQVEIMKEIPDELTMVFIHNIFATILALTVGLLAETNRSLWKIRLDISLISIICTGIFGKFLSSAVYAWAIHLKGPVYATMFKPISIVIAVAMGILFLGDTLHIGRFNEIYASRFEQGFPDLGPSSTSGPNSESVDDKDLSTKFTELDINKGNYHSRLDEDDDSDDYPDDNDFVSHKWVVKVTAAIANGESPMHFPQAVVQTYSFTNLHNVHVYQVPYGGLLKCDIETIPEPSGLDEKCMTIGWYDFARSMGLNIGDKIHLTVLNPVDRVCVRVERRTVM